MDPDHWIRQESLGQILSLGRCFSLEIFSQGEEKNVIIYLEHN